MSNFPAVQGLGGSLQSALTERVKVSAKESGGTVHLKYGSYTGEWTFGKDQEDVTGEQITVFTPSISHGWHLWADKKVTKLTVPFTEDIPEELPARKDERGNICQATEARGFQCMLEMDDDDTINLSWEVGTTGGRQAVDALLNEIRRKAMNEAEFLYPVVKLGSRDGYENPNKKGEMISPPKLEVVGWRNQEGDWETQKVVAIEEAVEDDAAPVVRRRKAS